MAIGLSLSRPMPENGLGTLWADAVDANDAKASVARRAVLVMALFWALGCWARPVKRGKVSLRERQEPARPSRLRLLHPAPLRRCLRDSSLPRRAPRLRAASGNRSSKRRP